MCLWNSFCSQESLLSNILNPILVLFKCYFRLQNAVVSIHFPANNTTGNMTQGEVKIPPPTAPPPPPRWGYRGYRRGGCLGCLLPVLLMGALLAAGIAALLLL